MGNQVFWNIYNWLDDLTTSVPAATAALIPAAWGSTESEIPDDCVRVEIPSKWRHVDVRVERPDSGLRVRALYIKIEIERLISLPHQRQRMLAYIGGAEIDNAEVVLPGTRVVLQILPPEDDEQSARFLFAEDTQTLQAQERQEARIRRDSGKEDVALDDYFEEPFEVVDPL